MLFVSLLLRSAVVSTFWVFGKGLMLPDFYRMKNASFETTGERFVTRDNASIETTEERFVTRNKT